MAVSDLGLDGDDGHGGLEGTAECWREGLVRGDISSAL
jgi:hypothetical protein